MSIYPTPFQKKTLWAAATGLGFFVIGALAVFGIWLIANTIGFLQPVLVPLAVAGIIAYLLEPVVEWLMKKRHLSRNRAIMVVFGVFITFAAILSLIIIPPMITQVGKLVSGSQDFDLAKGLQDQAVTITENYSDFGLGETAEWIKDDGIQKWINDNKQAIFGSIWSFMKNSFAGFLGIMGYLIGFALVPLYLFYFLSESEGIRKNWSQILPLKSSHFKEEVVETLQEINGYLIAFFRGQMLVSLIDGAIIGVLLFIIGLPYALVIGIFVAILGLIPYIGNLLAAVPAMLIAIAHFGNPDSNQWAGDSIWIYPLIVAGIFIAVNQIDGYFIAPKIVGNSVGLHAFTIIFSVLFWSLLIGGLLGSLLAVPLTASIKVLFQRYIWETRIKPAVHGDESAQDSKEDPPQSPLSHA